MRWFFLLALVVPLVSEAANRFVTLSTEQETFTAGEKAIVRAHFLTTPDNKNLEFFLRMSMNGAPLLVTSLTPQEHYAVTPPLSAGMHTVEALIFLQDKTAAQRLEAAIQLYASEIVRVNARLETETNPDVRAALLAERARNENRLASAQAELEALRTQVDGPATISLQVF